MWRLWNKNNLSVMRFCKIPFAPISNYIDINDEVKYALKNNLPIVALESTIITHGMPYPQNLRCAEEVEGIVREKGAVPATIAIMNGRIKAGLTSKELNELSDTDKTKPIKTSRRDFGYVISNKLYGGTTVAGTLIVSKQVGLKVFATGGLGGVHREAEKTFDISADLIELGKSPVAVVSSGVKSILDIPKTLEYLETQGVFVATYGSNKEFPAFYCRTSGCEAPYYVTNAVQAANIIKCHFESELQSGLLFAVPVQKEYEMNEKEMNEIINQAMLSAKALRISGKEITPYLLAQISKLTKGSSLETNIAFIKNNARVASEIAIELSRQKDDSYGNIQGSGKYGGSSNADNPPVVIGGSAIDCCATLKDNEIKLDGTLLYAKFQQHAGGVARNITEAMSKLGCEPTFISAVGNDHYGYNLRLTLPKKCSKNIYKLSNHSTAQFSIIFDKNGNCRILMGDTDIHQQITADMISKHEEDIKKSPLLILDGNLSLDAYEAALSIAYKHNVPVFFEPTDEPVSIRPFQCRSWKAIKYISPNLLELRKISSNFNISFERSFINTTEEVLHIGKLLVQYIPTIIVTMGTEGLIIVRKASATDPLLNVLPPNDYENVQARHYPAIHATDLVNVSGAGDCLASGIIVAMLSGLSEDICVNVGLTAAQLALYSKGAVPNTLFVKSHSCWNIQAKYFNLI